MVAVVHWRWNGGFAVTVLREIYSILNYLEIIFRVSVSQLFS